MKTSKPMIVLFLLPALTIFSAIFLYPILRTGLMSFFIVDRVTAPMAEWDFIGFGNYASLIGTPVFLRSIKNMLTIWLVGGAIVMTIALFFAVLLNSGMRGKKFFRAAIYMPNIISAVALAVMWIQFVFTNQDFGLANTVFSAIGLTPPDWLSPDMKFWSMLIAYCFGMVGYHMLIFSSGIEKIPAELYEAGHIDGASGFTKFRHLTLPLLKGVMRTNVIMWSITSVGFFLWSRLFATVVAEESIITPLVYLYITTFGSGNAVTERNAGLGAAIGVIMCVIVVVMFVIANLAIKDDDLEL